MLASRDRALDCDSDKIKVWAATPPADGSPAGTPWTYEEVNSGYTGQSAAHAWGTAWWSWGWGMDRMLFVEGVEESESLDDIGLTATFEPANGAADVADMLKLSVVDLDLDVDSDNDNGFDEPERDAEEDWLEETNGHSGKVALINDLDQDRDGLVDFVDGYNLFATVGFDGSSSAAFVPIVVELPHLDLSAARLKFTYSDSDPLDVTGTAAGYESEAGHMRLWAREGESARNGEAKAKTGGGDFIPSGEYEISSVFGSDRTKTLFAELVRVSDHAGDQSITVALDINGDGKYEIEDVVHLTATGVELIAYDYDGNARSMRSFVPTDLTVVPDVFTHTRFQSYVINVFDPRQGISDLAVCGQSLPLQWVDDHYQTPDFIVKYAGAPMQWVPADMAVIELSSPDVDLHYNPLWDWLFGGPSINEMPAGFEELGTVISEEVVAMEDGGWTPANPTDSGAFGKEVHQRVGQRMNGQPGWLVDVYVRQQANGSHKIVSIGAIPPGGTTGTTQIDLLYLADDYNPQVNDVLDPAKVQNLFDIKTSLGNGFSNQQGRNQLARLKAVIDGRDIVVARSQNRWTPESGWTTNKKFKLGAEVLGFIGVASSAWAVLNYQNHDEQLQAVLDDAKHVLERQQSGYYDNGAEGMSQRLVDLLKVNEGFSAYLSNFSPDNTITDIVKGVNTLVIINKVLE